MRRHLNALKSRSHDILRALGLVWYVTPSWSAASLALVLLQGLIPLTTLYLMKRLVDAVAGWMKQRGVEASGPPDPAVLRKVAIWVGLAGAVALLSILLRTLADIVAEAQNHRVTEHMTDLIHRQSAELDLAHYENSAYHDMMHLAQQEGPYRPLGILTSLTAAGQAGISLVGIGGLLLAFSWPMTLLLFGCTVPGALVRLVFSRKARDYDRRQTQSTRLAYFYHYFLTDETSAKELKLFGLGDLFRARYRDLRDGIRGGRASILRRRALADFLGQGLATVVLFACLGAIAVSALRGRTTVGEMVMYYQAFQTGLSQLQLLLRNGAQLFEHSLFLENFYRFLDLRPTIAAVAPRQASPARMAQGVRFQGVSFRYPGRDDDAVHDVTLEIAPGQVIALVGANGSGKSTIAKLLPRLYDPTSGTITVDGIDLRNLEPGEWRRRVSVVFQDYLRYPLTAVDNIRLGDLSRAAGLDSMQAAAKAAGVDELIAQLPQGYETVLGNSFIDGHELSGGEWQKMAVARAFFREAALVILDEPTSALDPLAEAELFQRFRALIQGRSAVLISHRFSTVQMADYIYVLDHGHVIEQGTHQELLGQAGSYARFYRAQADRFLGDTV